MSIDVDMLMPDPSNKAGFGQGFYWDLVLDQSGNPIQLDGVNKFVQGTVHLLSTDEQAFADYGYPEYGSKFRRYIGTKNTSDVRLKYQVFRDLQYYSDVKAKQHETYNNIDLKELITQLIAVELIENVDEQSVTVTAQVGDEDTLQFLKIDRYALSGNNESTNAVFSGIVARINAGFHILDNVLDNITHQMSVTNSFGVTDSVVTELIVGSGNQSLSFNDPDNSMYLGL